VCVHVCAVSVSVNVYGEIYTKQLSVFVYKSLNL
jgi:hypothetical protein